MDDKMQFSEKFIFYIECTTNVVESEIFSDGLL